MLYNVIAFLPYAYVPLFRKRTYGRNQISLPWQRGLVVVEFVWRHSIARPRKPPVIHKDLVDVSYMSRVIANFVPNFVAMATGVIRG